MEIKPSIPELFAKYLQFCTVMRNYSPVTIAGYKSTFQIFLKDTQCYTLEQLNKDILEEWFFKGRLDRKWSPVTFRHHHKHLNKFFEWLLKRGLIASNYALGIEKPRMEHKLPRTVSKEQGQLILDTSYHMKYSYRYERYRNHAVIGLMLLAGLRKREVINLKLQDISLETKTIFINQGKGNKDRMIVVNYKLYSARIF